MTETTTEQRLSVLQARFDEMIAANREEPGSYVLTEIAEVRLPLIGLALDKHGAELLSVQAERKRVSEESAAATQAFEQAKIRLLAAGEADKTAWFAEINCTSAIEALTKERDDLLAAQRSIRRARG